MQAKKLLLVTHKSSVRRVGRELSAKVDELTLSATASNLMEAYTAAEEFSPDVALVSPEFTELPEFEMFAALLHALDTRWALVTHSATSSNTSEKTSNLPYGIFSIDFSQHHTQLRRHILVLCNSRKQTRLAPKKPTALSDDYAKSVVLIGSSTGGIDALTEVLSRYPADCPATFIVQHTGEAFGENLVTLLNKRCAAEVTRAEDGQSSQQGKVYVAAGRRAHLSLSTGKQLSSKLTPGPTVSGHIPSVDALFESGVPIAKQVVACLLTGMGRDGAEGLLKLKKNGAKTFVQDEKTSVVYGMPRAAWELGAADQRVAIGKMCETILGACREMTKTRC